MMRTLGALLVAGSMLFTATHAHAANACTSMLVTANTGSTWAITIYRACDGAPATTVRTVTQIPNNQFHQTWATQLSSEVQALLNAGYTLSTCTRENTTSPPLAQCVFTK